MFYIDQFVHTNQMRTAHPGERVAFAIATMIITVAVSQVAIHLAVVAIMVGFLLYKAKIPAHVLLKLFSVPSSFLILGVITIAFQVDGNPAGMLWTVNLGPVYLGFTQASLSTAAQTLLKSLSAVSCLYFLVLTTPMTEIIHLLKQMHIPDIFLDLMMIIYRFIFVFVETAFHIYTSQSSRWGYAGFRRSIRSFGLLFANLWAKGFAKSQNIFTSLQSRGYEGEFNILTPVYAWSLPNIMIFGLIDLGLILAALYGGLLL
ncbi:MAG: cobalt ECF transporter T component CbiQ [Bacillota bacterium]|nr:cobalt ECF transporter T component CbiQ [Bacillota bacterium]MDW7684225.1 cobalt ECF transporter T component CbiQ [Bacillota bacterium]